MISQGKNTMDRILADSLKELVTMKPVEKITIKEITDRAGVIRPTFYNHFQDKYELLEWIIHNDLLDATRPLIENGLINQAMLLVFTSMEHQKEFFSHLSRMDGPVTFESLSVKCMHELLLDIFQTYSKSGTSRFPWLTVDMLAEHYSRSMCFAVKVWIRQGMTISPQEMADMYEYLINHSMEEVVKSV